MKPLIADYAVNKVSDHNNYIMTLFVDDDLLLCNGGNIDVLDYIVKLHCPISKTKFDMAQMAIICENITVELIVDIMHWIDKYNCMNYNKIQEFFIDLINHKYN